MTQKLSDVFTRRQFAGWSLGACVAGLAGCGGGGLDPLGESALAVKGAPAGTAGALLAQSPQVLDAPVFARLLALDELADGGFAVAWVRQEAGVPPSPRQVRVQRLRPGGTLDGPAVSLPVTLPDEDSAATVLRDGTTVLAWRRQVETPLEGDARLLEISLLHQRFGPGGQALCEPGILATVQQHTHSPDRLDLKHPRIARWPDGSHVVAWSRLATTNVSPGGLSVQLLAKRYHANGWPAGDPVDVGGSGSTWSFTLGAWEVQGGYVVGNIRAVSPPYLQVIRLVDFWNPIEPSRLEGLAQGSFLVSLGVCGSLLYAGRPNPFDETTAWERQWFNWGGQPMGPPQPLPGRPATVVPLRQPLGHFLELYDTSMPLVLSAQRKDKFGRSLGEPFSMPRASAIASLHGGEVAVASVVVSKTGNYALVVQRFIDPAGSGGLPA